MPFNFKTLFTVGALVVFAMGAAVAAPILGVILAVGVGLYALATLADIWQEEFDEDHNSQEPRYRSDVADIASRKRKPDKPT